MTDEHGSFAKAIADAISTGVTPVIVHGGGPQIGKALEAAGIESEFVGGFRVTTPQIFGVVEQVLVNEVGPTTLCLTQPPEEKVLLRLLAESAALLEQSAWYATFTTNVIVTGSLVVLYAKSPKFA